MCIVVADPQFSKAANRSQDKRHGARIPDRVALTPGRRHGKITMMSPPQCTIHCVTWQNDEAPLRAIRTRVFIEEQCVPVELEWDGEDDHAIHALAIDPSGKPIGTGRLLLHGAQAHIGRMAVVLSWRKQGVGAGLLRCLLDEAQRHGVSLVFLNAQTSAVPFYERFHFVREGAEFLDAGIPHYRMTLELNLKNIPPQRTQSAQRKT